MEKTKKELLIIGAGPAGLGAALYAVRYGIDFEIVDRLMPGGQITKTDIVENYPGIKGKVSGFEISQKLLEHCYEFDIKIKDYIDIEEVKAKGNNGSFDFECRGEKNSYIAKSIIIATGANPKKLNAKGEKELIGRGISFCATCDAALYRDRIVTVIGGGDTAVEEALFLTKFAEKVYIIHRRDELRAVKLLQERAFKNKKIEILWDSVVDEFVGNDKLESIVLYNKVKNTKQKIKVDGAFEYVGLRPNTELFKDLVKLDDNGFILTEPDMKTSHPGLYAAGDVRNTPLRQVITAVSDGAIAAAAVEKYLEEIKD